MLPCIPLLLAASTVSAMLSVPLERRAPGAPSAERFQAMATQMRNKYGVNGAKGAETRRHKLGRRANGTTSSVSLSDLALDSSYSAQLAIGTPPQTFSVIMDTGSSDLWLAGQDCTSCGMVPFDTTTSSSFKAADTAVRISYGSGQARGTVGSDTVQMGGFTVQGQTLAIVHTLTDGLKVNNVSGLMGLGFQAIATTKATPFWLSLVQGDAWAQPVMGFYITRWLNQRNAQAVEFGGVFTMGGTNTSLYTGDVDFVPLSTGAVNGFWTIPVVSVQLQGNTIPVSTASSPVVGAIDTGTTLIGAPPAFVQQFYANIDGAVPGSGSWEGFYLYPCETTINLALNFGSKTWAVSDADFKLMQVTDTQCAGGLFEIDTGGSASGAPDWIVGDTFLKNVYSVFRQSPASVGFAQLANPGDPTGAIVLGGGAARAGVSVGAVVGAIVAALLV